VAGGSEPAFRELYDAYHQRIYSFALFITHTDILAEEITQEIFIKVWTHRQGLSGINNFNAWLKTLVRNHSYTYLNRLARERLVLTETKRRREGETYSTEADIQDNEYSRLLKEAVSQLPEQQKKVYLLSRQDGLKHEEIAGQLGISVNTVKNHMKAALKGITAFLHGRTDALILLALALFLPD
jgi:RNA polymerase sigma-70 factor (family 1)